MNSLHFWFSACASAKGHRSRGTRQSFETSLGLGIATAWEALDELELLVEVLLDGGELFGCAGPNAPPAASRRRCSSRDRPPSSPARISQITLTTWSRK